MIQRDAVEGDQEEPGLDEMDLAMSGSADQFVPNEDDEDQMFMQQAPSDALIALQLLRSQFPAKARVGTFHEYVPTLLL